MRYNLGNPTEMFLGGNPLEMLAQSTPKKEKHPVSEALRKEADYRDAVLNLEKYQSQAPKIEKPQFGSQDLLTGLLPTLLLSLLNKDAGAAYGTGFLGGKQEDAERRTQQNQINAGTADRNQQNQSALARMALDFASTDVERAMGEQRYQDSLQAKGLSEDEKSARELQKRLFSENTDPAVIPALLEQLAGYGVYFSPQVVEGLKQGSYKVRGADAKTENTQAKTQTENQMRAPKVEGAKLKNKQTIATIANLNQRTKDMQTLLPRKVAQYQVRYKVDQERAKMYAATALTIGPKAEADIARTMATVSNLQSLSENRVASLDAKTKQSISSSLNTGLSTLSAQINTKESTLRSLAKDLAEADENTRPLIQSALDRVEGEKELLQSAYSDLASQAATLRQNMGYSADGGRPKLSQNRRFGRSYGGGGIDTSGGFAPVKPGGLSIEPDGSDPRSNPDNYVTRYGKRIYIGPKGAANLKSRAPMSLPDGTTFSFGK